MKLKPHDVPYVPFFKRISYLYIPAVFVLITILLEVTMFAVMKLAFPSAYIFSLTIVLTIATIATMVRIKWVQTLICSIFLGWQLFTTISTLIAYQTNCEIFSLETFLTLATAFNNAGAVDLNLWFLFPIIALLALYITAVILIMWFCNLPKAYRAFEKQTLFTGILAFISFFSYTFAYTTLPTYTNGYVNNLSSDKFLYDTFSNRGASLQNFGSYSYYRCVFGAEVYQSADYFVRYSSGTYVCDSSGKSGRKIPVHTLCGGLYVGGMFELCVDKARSGIYPHE